jgi:hypothetical protein
MNDSPTSPDRRTLMQSALGLALGQAALGVSLTAPAAAAEPAPGQVGDFDFLAGEWRISHRRLKAGGGKDWDVFEGQATCWTVLGGAGSIEELRIPARSFSGIGIRLLDRGKKAWTDFWVNGRDGVLAPPGTTGAFVNGVGTFEADDMDEGKPIKVRGVWDRITPTSHRWHQAVSRDGGRTWEENWLMDWTRV